MVSNPDFCDMVHLAPLTPAWPADLLVVALILVINMHANVYDLLHTTCAQCIIMNAHVFGTRAMRYSPRHIRHHGIATKVNNVLPV